MIQAFSPHFPSPDEGLIELARRIRRPLQLVLAGMLICGPLSLGVRADNTAAEEQRLTVVILKGPQLLEVRENGSSVRTYRVCLGLDPVGPKRALGDKKTPEGDYFICLKSTESQFHRFLGISYPGAQDAQAAFEKGMISLDERDSIIRKVEQGEAPPWNTKLGGWVGIHGYPSVEYHRRWASILFPKPWNWTDGCIALWNFEIEELFSRVKLGTPVKILP